jgi:hypothetical protein
LERINDLRCRLEGDSVMLLPFLKARIGGADIDMLPNPFSFATVGGQPPGTWVASAVVQITGISVPVPVTVNTGQFRILDATQTIVIQDWATLGSIKKGQCIQLRQISSGSYSGTVAMGVNVGKASVVWYVTTVSVTGGSASWGTPGVYYFTIPYYNQFNVDVYGAGGGGGGMGNDQYPMGGDGGYSYFNAQDGNVVGYGGGGGWGGRQFYPYNAGGPGANGTGVNGAGNITGGGAAGGAPGGYSGTFSVSGYPGGYGGRAYKSWFQGSALAPGSTIQIVVGQGGPPGSIEGGNYGGTWGGNGAVYVSWG